MVAVRNYITEDRSHLSFHKGDIIRLQHMDGLEAGETHANTLKYALNLHNSELLSASVKCLWCCLSRFDTLRVCV